MGAGGSIGEVAAALESAAIAEPAVVEVLGALEAVGFAANGATAGAPEDDVGAGISSVLKGVALSPSGATAGAGALMPPLPLFCRFKSAAGGTATEKVGAYNECIVVDGMSCISWRPRVSAKRAR